MHELAETEGELGLAVGQKDTESPIVGGAGPQILIEHGHYVGLYRAGGPHGRPVPDHPHQIVDVDSGVLERVDGAVS